MNKEISFDDIKEFNEDFSKDRANNRSTMFSISEAIISL